MRRMSRTPWYAAAALIALGGLLTAAAAAVRWFPCLGNLADQTCTARQSRVYDYLVPTEPSQALPATALLAGLGMVLLAASWPFIVRRLAVRPALRIVMAAILMLKPLLLGGMVLAAPVVGVLPREASPVLLAAEITLDIAALVVVLAAPSDRLPDYQRLLLATVAFWLVGWMGQVLDALLFGLLTLDVEVAPGSGLLTATIMIGCGVGIALITAHTPERGSPTLAARDPLERTGHR
jgi:hypothetical protein